MASFFTCCVVTSSASEGPFGSNCVKLRAKCAKPTRPTWNEPVKMPEFRRLVDQSRRPIHRIDVCEIKHEHRRLRRT